MKKNISIRLRPEELNQKHSSLIAAQLGVEVARIKKISLRKKSLDSRHFNIFYVLSYDVWLDNEPEQEESFKLDLKNVSNAEEAIIIGAGPAGLFCALRLIELGIKPIILEQGKAVRARRKDVANVNKKGIVDKKSNYCFGEGGAGTFSDGKLYTRSGKRGSIRKILETFVYCGADNSILIDAHPHIGTNKLPAVISNISKTIKDCGGEIHFDTKVEDIDFSQAKLNSKLKVDCDNKTSFSSRVVVAAVGHSARDFYKMLDKRNIELEAKPFAIGLRVEHLQSLVNNYRYGDTSYELPPASYTLNTQVENRGVYSFCMCPGGIICPAATSDEEVVVNGWSPSKRNSRFANSGIVVEVTKKDLNSSDGVFAGLELQAMIEQKAYSEGGGKLKAPAQRLDCFVKDQKSDYLPQCSYNPGVANTELKQVFPDSIYKKLRQAFIDFDKKLNSFVTEQAIVVAPESRTSSPIRIPRDPKTLMHVGQNGFFPCAEGAGYAGGIVSAAIDGQRVADAIKSYL